MARYAPKAAPAALALAMAAAAVFTFTRGKELTFYVDEWDFMLHRRGHGPDTFLDAVNGHLVGIPILVYKALFETVGADSYVPYRLTAIAVALLCAGLFFVYVRRRVGDAMALAATVTVLFFGPGWEPLMAPVGMVALISLAAGLGMLLALDARTRRGDVAAAVLLGISFASFSYGPWFAAAAAVDVLLRPGARRRIWLVVVPSALYGLWVLAYGESVIEWGNVPGVPRSVAESLSAVAASLSGLYRQAGDVGGGVSFDDTFGPPLALAFAAVVAYRLRGPMRESPRLWALVVLALSFWVSIGLVQDEGRTPTASRYLYPGAVFVLLIAAEILKGVRLETRGLVALAGLTAVLLVVNVPNLNGGARALANLARFDRAEVAALELSRGRVAPEFKPEPGAAPLLRGHYLENVDARSYFSAVDDFGSPAYSISELQRAPADPRQAADLVLAAANGLTARATSDAQAGTTPPTLEPGGDVEARTQGACLRVRPTGGGPARALLTLPPGGLLLRDVQDSGLEVKLRRFADGYGIALPGVSGPGGIVVSLPPDSAAVPWHAQVTGIRAPLLACGA